MAIDFPQRRVATLEELGARVLETHGPSIDPGRLAHELLAQFHGMCLRYGLDGTLVALGADADNRFALAEHPEIHAALTGRLDKKAEFDRGGPRDTKLRQLATCVMATLDLQPVEQPDRAIALADEVRAAAVAAIAAVVDVEFATPRLREQIIATARGRVEARWQDAFDKLAAELDERGQKVLKTPKIPIIAVQAAQRAFAEARHELMERAGNAAIDGAVAAIARADAEAAARIDRPVTHALTPRQIAIARAEDANVPKVPANITRTLLDAITELAELAWREPEKTYRPYAASQSFAIGEHVEHPKFGRGTVVTSAGTRIEVEFPDGKRALVQAAKK